MTSPEIKEQKNLVLILELSIRQLEVMRNAAVSLGITEWNARK